jgi:hypothetical protein
MFSAKIDKHFLEAGGGGAMREAGMHEAGGAKFEAGSGKHKARCGRLEVGCTRLHASSLKPPASCLRGKDFDDKSCS